MKWMKYYQAAATSIVISAVATFAQAQTIDVATMWPETNLHTRNLIEFAGKVKEVTDGEVTLTVHAGGALGLKGPEHLSAVRDGLVPAADYNLTFVVGDVPFFGIESLPFLIRDQNELTKFHEIVVEKYADILEENNQKLLYIVPWPQQRLYTKSEVTDMTNLDGLRIRVSDKNAQDIFQSLGASAILMPWGEVVPALASGRIDAVATSSSSGVDGKFWEFLGYVYPTNHLWSSEILTINLDTWNTLSEENQRKISDLAAEMQSQFDANTAEDDVASIAQLTKNGMRAMEISDEVRAVMQEKAQVLQADFLARVPEAKPFVDEYIATIGSK